MKKILFLFSLIILFHVSYSITYRTYDPFWKRSYVAYKVNAPIKIDGNIYSSEWEKAEWTEDFVDILGDNTDKKPKYRTRAKMLWDDHFLYIAVELMEPHIWGTKTRRDDTMYWDNDIEFFIDPTCLGQFYREFEFNALNTAWDILISKPPYRGGRYFFDWDAKKMQTAVKCYGTINDPSDIDEKWTFEAAVPFDDMGYVVPGTQWRINFSRVEWLKMDIKDRKYIKQAGFGGMGNEENWLWCPIGVVDAHRPERWGWLQFSGITIGEGKEDFNWNNDYQYKELLWTVSNRIQQYRFINKSLPKDLKDLEMGSLDTVSYQKIFDGLDYMVSVKSQKGVIYSLTGSDGFMEMRYEKSVDSARGMRKSKPTNPNNQKQTQKLDSARLFKRLFY